MLYLVETRKPIDQAAQALQEAIAKRRLSMLTVYSPTEILRKNGTSVERGYWVFEIDNPAHVKAVLATNPIPVTIPPCQIVVYEQGKTVKLATIRPTTLPEVRHDPGLQGVAEGVERLIFTMMDEVAGQ